jgi:hypothetical protein
MRTLRVCSIACTFCHSLRLLSDSFTQQPQQLDSTDLERAHIILRQAYDEVRKNYYAPKYHGVDIRCELPAVRREAQQRSLDQRDVSRHRRFPHRPARFPHLLHAPCACEPFNLRSQKSSVILQSSLSMYAASVRVRIAVRRDSNRVRSALVFTLSLLLIFAERGDNLGHDLGRHT